jgi:choline dehydrogenase-like flavoprotein
MNAMMFHYGAPSDYDEWARIIGDESWSYAKLQKQFRKMELYTPSDEHPLVDKSHRGLEGLMASTYLCSQSQDLTTMCYSWSWKMDVTTDSRVPGRLRKGRNTGLS